jgi:endonuclease/exonuclease/phosphatase family metal-dependent hydrolase
LLKRIAYGLGTLVIVAVAFAYWAVGESLPRRNTLSVEHLNEVKAASEPPVDEQMSHTFTVVSYNIAHGQGIKEKPTDWRDKTYTEKKLAEMALVLKRVHADFALLQEVDIDARRSHHINEAHFLAKEAGYPWVACALLWKKNYIPFPFWPPQHHLGYMESANCILSRYPLAEHERLVFDKPAGNPFWYNLGYIDRGVQVVSAKVGQRQLYIFNTHLEAWEIDARQNQAKVLADFVNSFHGPKLIGGDLNSIPADAPMKKGFSDEPETDYGSDRTLAILMHSLGSDAQTALKSGNPTFPADMPNRQLDHIFATGGLKIQKAERVTEAGTASDHLPIWARIEGL